MEKQKGLGQSNDQIPEDEMYLAKVLQNVRARGAIKVHGPTYIGDPKGTLIAACAMGAADLEPDTYSQVGCGLASGFEGWGDKTSGDDYYDVGMAYDDAIDERANPDDYR